MQSLHRGSRSLLASRRHRLFSQAAAIVCERLEERINFGDPNSNNDQNPVPKGEPPPDCGCNSSSIKDTGGNSSGSGGAGHPPPFPAPVPRQSSSRPVRYFDGMPIVESVDLVSNGFGSSLGVVRSWTGLNESSQIGNGWMIESLPYLVLTRPNHSSAHTARLAVMNSGDGQLFFDVQQLLYDFDYIDGMYGAQQRLSYVPPTSDGGTNYPGEFHLADAQGNVTKFYDLPRIAGGELKTSEGYAQELTTQDSTATYRFGAFKEAVSASGIVTTAEYASNGNLTALVRSEGSGIAEQFYFEYKNISNTETGDANVISRISLQRRENSLSDWSTIRWAEYGHYTGNGDDAAYGRLGDLKHVAIFESKAVASLTHASTTATATLPNHGYTSGDTVTIVGASQAAYNGTFTVTVTDANTFSYTMGSNPGASATGTISAGRVIDQKFYRYYKFHTDSWYGLHSEANDPTKAGGSDTTFPAASSYAHHHVVFSGLRTVIEGDSFARLSADHGSIDTFTDEAESLVDPYADHTFRYERYALNSVQSGNVATRYRVVEEVAQGAGCTACSGGMGTYGLSYQAAPFAADLWSDTSLAANSWQMKTTEYLPDSTNALASRNVDEEDFSPIYLPYVELNWPDHGFHVGERIVIAGAVDADLNGTFTISSVAEDSFQFLGGIDIESLDGDITVTNLDHRWADNDKNIVYTNAIGQVMLTVFVDHATGQETRTYYRYDENGRLILKAHPSAVLDYDDAYADLLNFSDRTADSIDNPDFEFLDDTNGKIETFEYYKLDGWVFDASSGLSHSNPSEGEQAAYILNDGGFRQTVGNWSAGSYTITVAASRFVDIPFDGGTHDLQIWVGSTLVETIDHASLAFSYDDFTTAPFPIAAGSHIVEFRGSTGTGETRFRIDNVRINGTGAPEIFNARFEFPFNDLTDAATGTELDGFYKSTSLQRGELGTSILLAERSYVRRQVDDMFRHLPLRDTVYAEEGGAGARITGYAYTFESGSLQPASVTISHPTVTVAHNGPGTAVSETTVYDEFGRPVWFRDGDGFISYFAYDLATSATTTVIQDVDSAAVSNEPSGWTTPSGGGLHLVTTMQVDGLGRTTKLTDPKGNATYTVYKDADQEIRTYRGWHQDGLNWAPTGPIEVYRVFQNGTPDSGVGRVYYETLTTSAVPTVANDAPTGQEAITAANIQSLTRQLTNVAGQIVEVDEYFSLSGLTYSQTSLRLLGAASNDSSTGNFHRYDIGYDRDSVKRVKNASGTITRTVRDGLGRTTSVWIGTDDDPDTGFWSPTNNSGANMVEVASYIYDGGGVGDGNLTKMTQIPGGGAADRVTEYAYEWRNRLVSTKSGATSTASTESQDVQRQVTYYEYDNLNRITLVEEYDGDRATISASRPTYPSGTTASQLRARSETKYDNEGRVFASKVFKVDPSSGTYSGSISLITNYWYDSRGNVIKVSEPGGLVTKAVYNGAGRMTKSYKSDGGDTRTGSSGGFDGTWDQALDVVGDVVLTQTEIQYDANGNVIATIKKDRHHDAIGTGELGTTGAFNLPSEFTFTLSGAPSGYNGDYTFTYDVDPEFGHVWWLTDSPNSLMFGFFGGTSGSFSDGATAVYSFNSTVELDGEDLVFTLTDAGGASASTTATAAPNARISYTANYYDAANRLTDSAQLGTLGGYQLNYEPPLFAPLRESVVGIAQEGSGEFNLVDDTLEGPDDLYVGYTVKVTSGFSQGNEAPVTGYDADSHTIFVEETTDFEETSTYILIPPIALVTSYGYDPAGRLQTVTDPKGIKTKTFYDALGRTTKTIEAYADGTPSNADDRTTLYTYDGSNHTLTMTALLPDGADTGTDPDVQTTQYMYGQQFAISGITTTLGTATATTTAAHGYKAGQQVMIAGATVTAYNGSVTVTAVGTSTTFSFAVSGSPANESGPAVVVRPHGAVWSNDQLSAVRYPDKADGSASAGEQETFTYNALGERLGYSDRNGTVHAYNYDALGRLTTDSVTTLGVGVNYRVVKLSFTFDSAGRPYEFNSHDATVGGSILDQVRREYNGFGQLVKEYQEHDGTVDGSTLFVTYTYSETDGGATNHTRLENIIYPNGRVVRYEYNSGLDDDISRLSFLADDNSSSVGTHLEELSYLGLDTVVKRAHPQPGLELTYLKQSGEDNGDGGDQYTGLDRFGRVADQRWRKTSGGDHVDRFNYTYDRNGNVRLRKSAGPTMDELYGGESGYDALNRLTSFDRGQFSFTPEGTVEGGDVDVSRTWELDALGNWTSNTIYSGDPLTEERTHNLQNQLTAVGTDALTYDGNGNLTNDYGSGNYPYHYDAWNRLVDGFAQFDQQEYLYRYDALGRRIYESDGGYEHALLYSNQWQVLEEREYGNVREQYVWSPVYVDALVLRDRDADLTMGNGLEERLYVQQDANYNVTSLVDIAGDVVERYVYDPYGTVTVLDPYWTPANPSYGWRYLHQGGRYDSITGLYHFRNRDYDPALGRWIQQDPAGYVDGMSLYQGLVSNPVNMIDPLGLAIPAGAMAGGGAGNFVRFVDRVGGGGGGWVDAGAGGPKTQPATRPTTCPDTASDPPYVRGKGYGPLDPKKAPLFGGLTDQQHANMNSDVPTPEDRAREAGWIRYGDGWYDPKPPGGYPPGTYKPVWPQPSEFEKLRRAAALGGAVGLCYGGPLGGAIGVVGGVATWAVDKALP